MKKLLAFLLLINAIHCYAQVDRTFWFAIPKETSGHGYFSATEFISFKIAAMNLDAHVTVSMPQNPNFVTQTFTVLAGQSYVDVLTSGTNAQQWAQFDSIYNNTAPNGSRAVSDLPGTHENRGFLITSDNDITIYYDYDNHYNRELYPLKGKNALGTEFYTPFQNIWSNGAGGSYNPKPYSDIEMVATVDGTQITITPPPAASPIFQGYANNNPITITLNRGQTFSLVANSETASLHPTGTHIVSNYPIAVTQNDDTEPVSPATCFDANGDQLVPTSIIGSKYLVMTGTKSINPTPNNVAHNTKKGEQIFVLSTAPATIVTFYGKDGTVLYTTSPLNAGQEDYYSVDISDPNKTSIFIQTDDPSKKIYVWHITSTGCEMGGAVLPPITNCTGSTEVSFYRSSTVNDLQINLMIPYDQSIPFTAPQQSYNDFTLYYSDGTPPFTIPGSWFEPNIPSGWAVLKPAYRSFNAITHVGQAHKITNTKDFFHLGLINGSAGITNKYGYFSSFNVSKGGARVASTETTNIISCLGDTVILVADGGLSYLWSYGTPGGPPTYISDPTSANPQVFCPIGNHDFFVDIHRSKCFGDTTIHISVKVLAPVTAAFETDKTVACAPADIRFTNKSVGALNYYWSYKLNSNPTVNFTPSNPLSFAQHLDNKTSPYGPMNYLYTLVADNNQGCTGQATKLITIYPQVIADFSASDTADCNPLPVIFTNNSGGDVGTYEWDFGDQNSSNVTSPTHTYVDYSPKDTIFHVQMVATSPYYCTDTARQNIHVYPYIKAGFTVDTIKGCGPLTIQVYNTSLGAISQYNWDFGDGSSSNTNSAQFAHTYINSTTVTKVYKLLLTVFNKNGCTDTLSRFISVYPQISSGFTASKTQGCNPLTVSFTNLSNPVATKYLWDFGDGATSSDKSPTHQYINTQTTDQTYKAKLTVMSDNYCTGYDSTLITVHAFLDPSFTVNMSATCTPYTATITNKSTGGIKKTPSPYGYTWNFGDGSISHDTTATLTHYYQNTTNNPINTTLSLTLYENDGLCSATLSRNITLYPEIHADFNANTYGGCTPLQVSFNNLSSPSAVATNYIWDFNDGASSSLLNPSHTFSNPASSDKNYQVKLIAVSNYNCKDSITKVVTAYSFINASFALDKPAGCSPDTVSIVDGSTGGISQYSWNYGDGVTDNNPMPSFTHVYSNKTNLSVSRSISLIVKNNHNCTDTLIRNETVYPQVTADFSTQDNTTEGCDSLSINFINASGPSPVPTHYDWDFGDGGSSVDQNPSHLFVHPDPNSAFPKVYKTKLYAYSQYNCKNTDSTLITVYPFIRSDFSINQATGCSPATLTFANSSSSGANTFQWSFGDGSANTNSASSFTKVYQNLTGGIMTFFPTLTASYNGKCPSTSEKAVQIYPQVTASFTQDTLKGCHPASIQFTNTSSNALRYNWNFGDFGTSIEKNPSHSYTNFSNVDSFYTVSLLATSMYNCSNSTSRQITIYPKPKARFNVENSIDCPPFKLNISNLSEAADTFHWNFGDGTYLSNVTPINVTHTYDNTLSSTKSYILSLKVTTSHNCTDSTSQTINVYPHVIAAFSPDTAGCSDLLVPFRNTTQGASSFDWVFGDGITSNLSQPSHDYYNLGLNDTTFKVTLISYSKFGCHDSTFHQVTVYPQPKTAFSALPTFLDYPNSKVSLVNATNAGNWSYLWNFNDGTSTQVKDPLSHTFATWGHYNVELKAWSAHCSDSTYTRITVVPPVPIADFDMTQNVCLGGSITFTDKSTWASSWKWDFGDGATSTEQNPPPHIYPKPGIYHVQLTISGDGGSDLLTQDVEIYPLPAVQFKPVPNSVLLPNSNVKFYNTSELGVKYLWEFGDNQESSETEPTHTYKDLGNYTVSLSVWTQHNCFDSLTIANAVSVKGGGKLRFPNVFTPDPNGPSGGKYDPSLHSATIFYPYSEYISKYDLEIYDRWGEKLFQTDDISIGWDGYYKGKLCKTGVYIWKATGKFTNGTSFDVAGDVTLLK